MALAPRSLPCDRVVQYLPDDTYSRRESQLLKKKSFNFVSNLKPPLVHGAALVVLGSNRTLVAQSLNDGF